MILKKLQFHVPAKTNYFCEIYEFFHSIPKLKISYFWLNRVHKFCSVRFVVYSGKTSYFDNQTQQNKTKQIKINLHIHLIKKFEYFFNFSAIKWVNRNFFTESHTCPCIIRHVNVQNLLHTVCFDGWRQNPLKRQLCMFALAKICLLSR